MKTLKPLEKRIEELDSIVGIQCSDGNWNTSEYMLGMANGLLLAQATMKDEEPVYKKRPDEYLAPKGLKPTATPQMMGEHMWDINEIKSEHYESSRDKAIVAVVQDGEEFGVYQQTKDSVSPYFKYPNARRAAARVLQLLGLGPVAPQDYPEEVCIGEIEYASAEVLPFAPADDREQVLSLIRSTLDAPTFLDLAANCRNLTKTLMEIERLLNRTRESDPAK